jgi:Ca-activated chloride channel homolog
MKYISLITIVILLLTASRCSKGDDSNDGLYSSNNSNNYNNDVNNFNNTNNESNNSVNNSNNQNNIEDPEEPEEFDPSNWPPETCDDNGPLTLFLSADDSNSQASPVFVRREILSGKYLFPKVIRPWEFLNYATFSYQAPQSGLAIYPEMRVSEDASGLYTFQIGVRSKDRTREDIRPMNLVLILDSSGSMAGSSIELLKQSVQILINNLRDDDRVTIVRMNAFPTVLVDNEAPQNIDMMDLFSDLRPNGVTDLTGALVRAYDKVEEYMDPLKMNRVVIFSDGAANAGITDLDMIKELSGTASSEGVHLMGVGIGESFNDELLDALTDEGRGAYIFIDSTVEAEKQFNENFVSNFDVAALDVKVMLTLPSAFSVVKFHGEEISENPSQVKPQNLAPNDQMIFNQIVGTCLPEATTGLESFEIVVSWVDPESKESKSATELFTLSEILEDEAPNLLKGNALAGWAETLKALYELRNGSHDVEIDQLCETQQELFTAAGDDPELTEAALLASTYCNIVKNGENHEGSCDEGSSATFTQALGICTITSEISEYDAAVGSEGTRWGAFSNLYESSTVLPREGYKFAALSTGRVSETVTIPGLAADASYSDPMPRYYGEVNMGESSEVVYDLSRVSITMTAPLDAHSFSFDFNFFSAEYPDFIGSNYNDTFYAILESEGTNGGVPTNISFDSSAKAIEINNNYFANPYHPCSEANTGFVNGASTCWLRTSWPISPGEEFTLTFTIHDEGDSIYSSTILLDNFKFHSHDAVGMTDPL